MIIVSLLGSSIIEAIKKYALSSGKRYVHVMYTSSFTVKFLLKINIFIALLWILLILQSLGETISTNQT